MGLLNLLFPSFFPCKTPVYKTGSSEEILRGYRNLVTTGPGECYYRRHQALQKVVLENQDSLYELIFSGKLTDEETYKLAFFGAHGGSVSKNYNMQWVAFTKRLRDRQSELPMNVQEHLNALKKHGW